jgi:hypothetical protein
MKSYNVQALRGHKYDDKEFQSEMKEVGVDIPDKLLYTPELGPYVINQIHNQTKTGLPEIENPETGQLYTADEATKVADTNRKSALDMYNTLLKMK